jgi:hypothetical protein
MSIPKRRTLGEWYVMLGWRGPHHESDASWYVWCASTVWSISWNYWKHELRSSPSESQQTITRTMNHGQCSMTSGVNLGLPPPILQEDHKANCNRPTSFLVLTLCLCLYADLCPLQTMNFWHNGTINCTVLIMIYFGSYHRLNTHNIIQKISKSSRTRLKHAEMFL